MRRVGVRGAEHHQRRPPPAVERVLRHALLRRRSLREAGHGLVALALVEALLLADADHRTRVGAVGAAAERDLVHDRRPVHQPADRADIRPGDRRVVEDRGIARPAFQQAVHHLRPGNAERLGRGVEVKPVPALVLHLGEQDRLAAQARRARQPIALRQHADNLGMGVLADLADQRLPVGLGHPVVRLDLLLAVDLRLEAGQQFRILGSAVLDGLVEPLRVHGPQCGTRRGPCREENAFVPPCPLARSVSRRRRRRSGRPSGWCASR